MEKQLYAFLFSLSCLTGNALGSSAPSELQLTVVLELNSLTDFTELKDEYTISLYHQLKKWGLIQTTLREDNSLFEVHKAHYRNHINEKVIHDLLTEKSIILKNTPLEDQFFPAYLPTLLFVNEEGNIQTTQKISLVDRKQCLNITFTVANDDQSKTILNKHSENVKQRLLTRKIISFAIGGFGILALLVALYKFNFFTPTSLIR